MFLQQVAERLVAQLLPGFHRIPRQHVERLPGLLVEREQLAAYRRRFARTHANILGPVRDGILRELDLLNLAGIVTFPSFHACSAVLYAWALWPVWWMRPIALLANGAMLASTPVDGGHYFIDLFAGIAVAVVAIAAARAVTRRIGERAIAVPARERVAVT